MHVKQNDREHGHTKILILIQSETCIYRLFEVVKEKQV